jgi:hypothetical protein
MVLTVVVARTGFGTLVVVGLVATGGVDAMTNDVTSGPACVVGVVDRRTRTCLVRTLVAPEVAAPEVLFASGRFVVAGVAVDGDFAVCLVAAEKTGYVRATAAAKDLPIRRIAPLSPACGHPNSAQARGSCTLPPARRHN